ncbi:restriction endonuclease subunit S [Burkholderia thailandensis]|uniref:restriction endonuclease subunit S n=1 Tax=Burkholderia thailandensis TaxID=57975 RepID=UPI0021654F18|nr:restriction endonuclease subunit S [Burkholderia thailandensis]MCS3390043.1 restriction endonuclease subunit S [Burkholderia thailandensis]
MSLPRYPKYKDSKCDWFRTVPMHWDVSRLKLSVSLVTEKTDRRSNPIALENIEGWSGKFVPTETEFAGDGVAFEPGDILFGKLRPYLAKAYLADSAGEAVGDFHVLRPTRTLVPRFLQYLVLSQEFIAMVDGSTFGSKMPRVSWEFLANMLLAVPPRDEQSAIVAFLDRETGKIDTLIAEQEKLLVLLAEKRQATVSHAVTRGLSPDALMKDSGVAWLGDVPAHWEVKQLRYIAKIVRGASPRPAGDPLFFAPDNNDGSNTPWVTVAEVTKDTATHLESVSEFLTPLGAESSQYFERGTLIFTNSGATLGVPKILAIDCCANDGILAFKNLSPSVDSLFLYFFLLTTTDRLRTEMKQGGGQPNLNTDIVKSIFFAKPSTEEQSAIAAFLQLESARLDSLKAEAERAIDLLKERRSALIAAAVTGKIDVRNTVPQELAA